MSRRIILERSVSVRCWRVVGQIARTRERTELMAALLRASENDGTDTRDLAEHLLFDSQSRRVVAERLLHIGVTYGLLEEQGRRVFVPTEAGRQAIHTGEVFVPEDGAWSIWASDDPVLPSPVLRIEPWSEPTAYDEINGKQRKNPRKRREEALPAWLREVIKTPVTTAAGHAEGIRIDHLADKAEAVNSKRSLRLRWNVGNGRPAAHRKPGRWEGSRTGGERSGSTSHVARTNLEQIARKRGSPEAVGRGKAGAPCELRRDGRRRAGDHVP